MAAIYLNTAGVIIISHKLYVSLQAILIYIGIFVLIVFCNQLCIVEWMKWTPSIGKADRYDEDKWDGQNILR